MINGLSSLDNLFNGTLNNYLGESNALDFIKNAVAAVPDEEHQAPNPKPLATGGEALYRIQLVNPQNQSHVVCVDLYVKAFLKLSRTDYRIKAVRWDLPDVTMTARGSSAQEAYNKIIEKIFYLNS